MKTVPSSSTRASKEKRERDADPTPKVRVDRFMWEPGDLVIEHDDDDSPGEPADANTPATKP